MVTNYNVATYHYKENTKQSQWFWDCFYRNSL